MKCILVFVSNLNAINYFLFFFFAILLQSAQEITMADSDSKASNPSKTLPQYIAALAGKLE